MTRKPDYIDDWPGLTIDPRICMMPFTSPGTFACPITVKFSDPCRDEGEAERAGKEPSRESYLATSLRRTLVRRFFVEMS